MSCIGKNKNPNSTAALVYVVSFMNFIDRSAAINKKKYKWWTVIELTFLKWRIFLPTSYAMNLIKIK